MSSRRILVIEDEELLRNAIANSLEDDGYLVSQAGNAQQGMQLLREKGADLLLLDLMLPDRDGFELLQDLRSKSRSQQLPIIIITARDAIPHRVKGLDMGADDYMIKPLSLIELKARIRNHLKNLQSSSKVLEFGSLRLDSEGERVYSREENADWSPTLITPLEFHILWILATKQPQIVERGAIIEEVFAKSGFMIANTLDVHIYNMRRKIGTQWIGTAHRKGFRFQVPRS